MGEEGKRKQRIVGEDKQKKQGEGGDRSADQGGRQSTGLAIGTTREGDEAGPGSNRTGGKLTSQLF